MERRRIKTAVVGGGAAGCSAAYQLASTDRKIVLFEQSSSLGGRSSTQRVEDLTVDTGAGFFTNYYPLLSKYIAEVGLEHEVVSLSRRAGLVHDGKICKIELGNVLSLLRFPHIGWLDKLVMLRHMFGLYLRRDSFDLVDPHILARFDNRPIAEHFRNALGDRLYEFLLRPTVEPFWY